MTAQIRLPVPEAAASMMLAFAAWSQAAEEAELAAKLQQQVVAQRRLQLEIAKSDAGFTRSRSRCKLLGSESPPPIIMDAVPGGFPQPAPEAQPVWMSQDLERELSALIGRDTEARAQNEALKRAKQAFSKHSNSEERKVDQRPRMASFVAEHQQAEGIALNRHKAELRTTEAAQTKQFQAAMV